MKQLIQHRRGIILLSIMALGSIGRLVVQHICSTQYVMYTIDPLLADSVHQHIKNIINAQVTNQQSLQQLMASLQHEFPYIQDGTLAKVPRNTLHLTLTAHPPQCIINDSWVFTKNGSLFSKDIYTMYARKYIPYISVTDFDNQKEHALLPTALLAIMQRISAAAFLAYDVELHSVYEIFFHDKKESQFELVCSVDQLPTKSTLRNCAHIKNVLQGRGAFEQRAHWIADIRFKNQIVVYKGLGG